MEVPDPGRPLVGLERFRTFVDGLDHPEGVARGPDGYLYAGGEAGQVYRIGPDGRIEQIASTGGFILGVALDADANVYACDLGRAQVMRVSATGGVRTFSSGTADAPMVNPNYGVFDAVGRLYVSDSGRWQRDDGAIFVILPDGSTRVASRSVRRFPNGLALSADGGWLYVVESTLPGISRLEVRADGSLGATQEVVRLPGHVPDGLAFDAEGALYIACYRPDRVYRLSRDGALTVWADDPTGTTLAAPTNLAFAGPALDLLVVANLGRWHLAATDTEVPGQPLWYPRLGGAW